MLLNLSRNVVAMEKAIRLLEEAERYIDDCSSCLLRDVIVSEAQAADHNRSIVRAKDAVCALREQLAKSLEEVSGNLQQAQIQFVLKRDFTAVARGYTAVTMERPEPDLSALAFVAEGSGSAAVCNYHDHHTTKRNGSAIAFSPIRVTHRSRCRDRTPDPLAIGGALPASYTVAIHAPPRCPLRSCSGCCCCRCCSSSSSKSCSCCCCFSC